LHVERGLEGYLEFCRGAVKDSLEFETEAGLEEAERRLAIPDEVRDKGMAKAKADRALARKLLLVGAQSIPSGFFANGRWVKGKEDDERRRAVEEELGAAKEALAKGIAREAIYVERVLANYQVEDVLPEEARQRWLAPVDGVAARGPADAHVTLVEWGDYQCPFCRRAHATVAALEKKYTGKIRTVFRHRPLPFHKGAGELAALTLEARAQKGDVAFFAVHDALMAGKGDAIAFRPLHDAREAVDVAKRKGDKAAIKDAETKLKEETDKLRPPLETFAKEMGLDPKKTATAVLGGAWDGPIELDEQAGDDAGVSGTPTFFVNGRKIVGAQPEELFSALVDLELAVPAKPYAELQKSAKKRTRELPKLDGDPSRGPKKAKLTLDVYCNYSGWFAQCVERAYEVKELEAQWRGQIRVVWHALRAPGEHDTFVVSALHEAREQKGDAGFFKLNDAILATTGPIDRGAIEALGKKAGLDAKKLAAALDSRKHEETEEARAREARAAGLLGATVVLEGHFLAGDRLKRAVALAMKRK
jgi:protein-disulfide isomerase